MFAFRKVTGATNKRTSIATFLRTAAVSDGGPLVRADFAQWLHAFRDITNATNERTLVSGNVPKSALGNSAPAVDYMYGKAVSAALVMANMNSIPLDWGARFSVGGVHMNFFILKQLPVLPPKAYLEESSGGPPYVQLIVPRVLELTYTSEELKGFATDLGFDGPPFPWEDERRHCLRCELDAIFAQMYGLARADLEWILDPQAPSSSFPSLKQNEIRNFGEYRTQRYVLQAFDSLKHGQLPELRG